MCIWENDVDRTNVLDLLLDYTNVLDLLLDQTNVLDPLLDWSKGKKSLPVHITEIT